MSETSSNAIPAYLPLRNDLIGEEPYGAPQLDVPVCLNVNENPYAPEPAVVETIAQRVKEIAPTLNRYPDREHIELRKAFSTYLERESGVKLSVDQLWGANGSNEIMLQLFQAFGGPGRIALGCDPTYSMYPEYARDTFTTWKLAHRNADFTLDVDATIKAIEDVKPAMIVLTSPNNPTGTTITKDELQVWVDYANKNGAVIIYDAAYEAYISEDNVAHTIYECEGAKTCAIELKSFSKNAGFTGVRLGYTVVPKELKCGDVSLNAMWARRHGTKFNGAPYIQQRAGEAVYSEAGKAQLKEQVAYYMNNAKTIKQGLKDAGYTVFGGVNAPYIWLKTPGEMTSWEFFDYLLENANVVGTPGSGFGPSGEGYFRLTGFGTYENTVKAIERIKALNK